MGPTAESRARIKAMDPKSKRGAERARQSKRYGDFNSSIHQLAPVCNTPPTMTQ